jgi:enamine deaminase RidA (YjgF/YER057c/UK114 family)
MRRSIPLRRLSMRRISSGAPWEDIVGYSRAVVAGNLVEVSGTTATDADGNVVAPGDAYTQTRKAMENLIAALSKAGARVEDVIRTRLYVTDISRWREYGRAHAEFFGSVKPATTMVEVSRLIHPDMVVEVEATAVLEG